MRAFIQKDGGTTFKMFRHYGSVPASPIITFANFQPGFNIEDVNCTAMCEKETKEYIYLFLGSVAIFPTLSIELKFVIKLGRVVHFLI